MKNRSAGLFLISLLLPLLSCLPFREEARAENAAVHIFDPARPFSIDVETGDGRTVRIAVDNGRYIARLPDDREQVLLTMDMDEGPLPLVDGKARIMVADVTFDGLTDVLIHTNMGYGGVNAYYETFLWDARAGRFREGELVSNPEPQAERKVLLTGERSGPVWYVTEYRGDGPHLWKWRTHHAPGPLRHLRYFDRRGRLVKTVIAALGPEVEKIGDNPRPAVLFVSTRRSFFHRRPREDARMRSYLVRGDRVTALDASGDYMEWLKVRYRGRHGEVIGWLDAETLALPGGK